jgi:2-dehydropantoate 2-reductase
MRMLVVGAGAIGGFYGAHLARAGRDVTLLVRQKRAQQLKSGLEVKSPKGDFTVAPELVTAATLDGPYDAILVAVKSYALQSVMADMARAVGPETMILAPLNGMKHVDMLSERFGALAVVGCIAKIAVDLDAEGRVIHFAPIEETAYGEMDGSLSPRIQALDEFLQGAGFTARHSTAIVREMWEKWILLSGLGGINCLMRGAIGEVEAAPGGRDFVSGLVDEILAIVAKVGVAPSAEFLGAARGLLTAKGSPMTSSMYRDLIKGDAVEADTIIGDLLARGLKAGVSAPLLGAVYAHLCVYQNRLGQTA